MPPQLASARNHYRISALIARRAASEVRKTTTVRAAAGVVAVHQATQAARSQAAVAEMLAEQSINEAADALLNTLAFTTAVDTFAAMVDQAAAVTTATDSHYGIDRLVLSLVQDAGRAAESVATTVRPHIVHVRHLSPPSCARCAVLAGRIYRYSEGFKRHPGCDCVMVPTTVDSTLVEDPADLARRGLVRGLSKADAQAIADGADFSKVVNVRLQKAGLADAGRVLARRGRLTPEGIYASTSSREEAVSALLTNGYIT